MHSQAEPGNEKFSEGTRVKFSIQRTDASNFPTLRTGALTSVMVDSFVLQEGTIGEV